ncbi:hypothetical protein [Pseudoalteromonas tetraodonis]|uniref:hypothetical protein n=1 Tax=Pseudoalteromonas tetraodonis TaxID=43659 RepID=UPI003A96BF8C
MQQQIKPTANQQMVQPLAPKKKAINKTVTPINRNDKPDDQVGFGMPVNGNGMATDAQPSYQGGVKTPDYLKPTNGKPVDKPGFGMPIGGKPTGLMGYNPQEPSRGYGPTPTPTQQAAIQGTGKTTADITQQANNNQSAISVNEVTGKIPQTTYDPIEYNKDGYEGVKGQEQYNYDPRDESLVQNQITGLLDPNSALMRKSIAQAQNYSASRGLQSSSIGSETALSSMIDKALPIAQQDAGVYANADQAGWQNSFNAQQNNLSREHDASMFDKQGQLQVDLQNNQYGFQNNQNNADRQQQFEMQQKQYDQSIGTLEKQAQIQKERDKLMNQFDSMKMDKAYLQDLEKTKLTWERADTEFAMNLDANTRLQYQNASADSYNRYLEQVALVYSNPNMTPEQQTKGVETLEEMFITQEKQLKIIYGIIEPPASDGDQQQTGVSDPNNDYVKSGSSSGGSGGGRPGGNNMQRLM